MIHAYISYFSALSMIDDKHLYANLLTTKTFEYDKPPQIFENLDACFYIWRKYTNIMILTCKMVAFLSFYFWLCGILILYFKSVII